MWIPERFELPEQEAYAVLGQMGAGDLLTPTDGGIEATFLPLLLDRAGPGPAVLRGHLARDNPHVEALRARPETESLVVVHATDAYVSPTWYASRASNPRAVPTWNYSVVHVRGRARLFDGPDELWAHLRALADHFEDGLPEPWSIDDAPADHVARLARAIVGVEIPVESLQAKAKQSQDKAPPDVAGVATGLRAHGQEAAAAELERANRDRARRHEQP